MALLIRLDAVYGPGRVPEATGTGTSCPVRLGSPTGDSRREVEPPGRRLRAASAAPARRDFIRHLELAARGRAATPRLPVGVGAFGSPFAKHTRGNKRRRGAGEGFCDPTHRDPRPA